MLDTFTNCSDLIGRLFLSPSFARESQALVTVFLAFRSIVDTFNVRRYRHVIFHCTLALTEE